MWNDGLSLKTGFRTGLLIQSCLSDEELRLVAISCHFAVDSMRAELHGFRDGQHCHVADSRSNGACMQDLASGEAEGYSGGVEQRKRCLHEVTWLDTTTRTWFLKQVIARGKCLRTSGMSSRELNFEEFVMHRTFHTGWKPASNVQMEIVRARLCGNSVDSDP